MKKIILMFALVILSVVFVFNVSADVVNFGDSTIHWSGYASSDVSDNSRDVIGQPDFTGGSLSRNGGTLQSLTFNYVSGGNSLIHPADLFIFTPTDSYAVRLSGQGAGGYGLFKFNQADGYIMSDAAWTTPGYDIRNGHPVMAGVLGEQVDGVWFTGWDNTSGEHQSSFLFNDLMLGDNFEFAWSVNCANDVIRDGVSNPVPEPATLLLMGFGSGFLGYGIKRIKKIGRRDLEGSGRAL